MRWQIDTVKVSTLGFLITASLLLGARADLTVAQKIEGADSVTDVTFKIKGDKVRIETPGGATTIIDKKTGDILLLSTNKVFKRIPGTKPKEIEKSKLAPTGRKESILGHETDEFVFETPSGKSSFWIALKYPEAAAITRQLQPISPDGGPNYRDLPGVPIRIHRKTSGGKEVTITVTSIKQDPLSDADYLPPKDFVEEGTRLQPSASPSSKP
jgi:hypothetical protein